MPVAIVPLPQSNSLTRKSPDDAPQGTLAFVPKVQVVLMSSFAAANRAQSVFVAEVFEDPLIPISKELSHAGQDEEVLLEARRLPSALKTRVACCPEPGVAGVPLTGEASKLPVGLD